METGPPDFFCCGTRFGRLFKAWSCGLGEEGTVVVETVHPGLEASSSLPFSPAAVRASGREVSSAAPPQELADAACPPASLPAHPGLQLKTTVGRRPSTCGGAAGTSLDLLEALWKLLDPGLGAPVVDLVDPDDKPIATRTTGRPAFLTEPPELQGQYSVMNGNGFDEAADFPGAGAQDTSSNQSTSPKHASYPHKMFSPSRAGKVSPRLTPASVDTSVPHHSESPLDEQQPFWRWATGATLRERSAPQRPSSTPPSSAGAGASAQFLPPALRSLQGESGASASKREKKNVQFDQTYVSYKEDRTSSNAAWDQTAKQAILWHLLPGHH